MAYSKWPSSSGSYSPLTYIRGVPIDVTLVLIAVHTLTMLVIAVLVSVERTGWAKDVIFSTDVLSTGKFWTIFTYPFVHNIAARGIWFAVEMLMFFWFGREVERFIGRNGFLWFYSMLVVVPPAAMIVLSPLFGPLQLAGSHIIHFGVFIGFVTIYPNLQFFFGLVAKWLAVCFLAVFTLVDIAGQNWPGLAYLWLTVGTAYGILRYAGVGGGLPLAQSFEAWREQKQQQKQEQQRQRVRQARQQDAELVDEILEKIARDGIDSLSPQERSALEEARQRLVNRDKFKKS